MAGGAHILTGGSRLDRKGFFYPPTVMIDVPPDAEILREERAHEVGGVLHSYSGGEQLVGTYRDLNMCFSFAGPITYRNARRPVQAARSRLGCSGWCPRW